MSRSLEISSCAPLGQTKGFMEVSQALFGLAKCGKFTFQDPSTRFDHDAVWGILTFDAIKLHATFGRRDYHSANSPSQT